MRFLLYACVAMFSLALVIRAPLAADKYINAPAERPDQPNAFETRLVPGVRVILPGGGYSVIEEYLPDGNMRASGGMVISPEGVILEGEGKGLTVAAEPDPRAPIDIQNIGNPAAPDPVLEALPATPIPKTAQPAANAETKTMDSPSVIPPGVGTSLTAAEKRNTEAKKPDEPVTLAQMLPLTSIRSPKSQPEKAEQKESIPPKKEEKKHTPAKTEKAAAKNERTGAAEKPKVQEKPRTPPKSQKVEVGQPLRIPPEAIQTGNLDFLEGCWEGARPEYISKRTVKECFCFESSGGVGKRRIYDRSFNRQCIGATRATLSKDGVLSVTSREMPCSDGVMWGSAEMVCHNSGPRTPCSWVFRDAGNGRQAYEIPFVRVQSCRR